MQFGLPLLAFIGTVSAGGSYVLTTHSNKDCTAPIASSDVISTEFAWVTSSGDPNGSIQLSQGKILYDDNLRIVGEYLTGSSGPAFDVSTTETSACFPLNGAHPGTFRNPN